MFNSILSWPLENSYPHAGMYYPLFMTHQCNMLTPFSFANASFCFFLSRRRTFAFSQRGLVGSGPTPGAWKKSKTVYQKFYCNLWSWNSKLSRDVKDLSSVTIWKNTTVSPLVRYVAWHYSIHWLHWTFSPLCFSVGSVSYTHLTLPTKLEV